MFFKIFISCLLSCLTGYSYATPSEFPRGRFVLFYNSTDNNEEHSIEAPLLDVIPSLKTEDIFPLVLYRAAQELESRNLFLGYENFFKSCTKSLVDFAAHQDCTTKEDLELDGNRASFFYDPQENSKDFCVETAPEEKLAWIKFYMRAEEEN